MSKELYYEQLAVYPPTTWAHPGEVTSGGQQLRQKLGSIHYWTLDKPNPFRFEKAVIPDKPERISERLKPPFSGETGV